MKYYPRIHEEHLKQIYTGTGDSRVRCHAWLRALKILGIEHDHKVDYRYSMCTENDLTGYSSQDDPYRFDRIVFSEWIREDEEKFQSRLEMCRKRKGLVYPPLEHQGLEQVP